MRLPSLLVTATLTALLLLAAGCGRSDRPPDVGFPDSLFVEALAEVHLAAARAAHTGEDADSLRTASLAGLGLDTTRFARALDAYAARPSVLLSAYDRAVDRLVRLQIERYDGIELLPEPGTHVEPDILPGDRPGDAPIRDPREMVDLF